jgi:diguanylate cyclase (GGDEF)-like protein
MPFDLLTLYALTIGTLLVSAAMTFWERQARPQRQRALGVLAVGYLVLGMGCALALGRHALPGFVGSALCNIIFVAGYLLVLNGAALLRGRTYRAVSAGIIVLLALGWALAGPRWPDACWAYGSAVPIAAASGLTMWEILRNPALRSLRSRPLAIAVTGEHAVFYAGRAFVLPVLVGYAGPGVLTIVGKITMFEAVLFAVAMPMTLLALVREEAHDRLLVASRTDYLTGLGNRQWFFEEGAHRIAAGAGRAPLTLLAFDLDHFKAINDRHGHATGDAVLAAFAHIVRAVTGPDAVLARIGGEEFAALLPGQDRTRARRIGQAVVERLAATVVPGADAAGVTATVSIGLAEYGADMPDLAALIAAADRALYRAKAMGRNRIEIAPAPCLAAVA